MLKFSTKKFPKKRLPRKLEKFWNIQGFAIFQHENFKINELFNRHRSVEAAHAI
jgi:hypothetical protein